MKKSILFTVNFLILIISAVCIDSHDAYAETEYELFNPTYDADKDYAEWDCIYFGWYPQDSADENDLQPVKWRVLSVEDGKALLLSDRSLMAAYYNMSLFDKPSWGSSHARFQTVQFYNKAFSKEEQEMILLNNELLGKIFILSLEEVCNSEFGFCANPETKSDTRKTTATEYALSKEGDVTDRWWLRTRGEGVREMFVSASGNVALTGDYLMNDAIGAEMKYYLVIPVMWLDLSNNDVWGYAGKTASDGNVYSDDIPTPTPLPTNIPTQSPQQDLTVTPSVVPSAPVPTPVKQPDITVQADRTFESGKLMYKVISGGKNKVYVCGVRQGKKQVKAVEIPGKVYHKGTSYKVTGIEANAFVKCRKLKRVTIKSKTLKYIGKNAFRKGKNKPVIKMPKKQYKRYCRLLKKSVK